MFSLHRDWSNEEHDTLQWREPHHNDPPLPLSRWMSTYPSKSNVKPTLDCLLLHHEGLAAAETPDDACTSWWVVGRQPCNTALHSCKSWYGKTYMDDSYVHRNHKLGQANRRRITIATHQRASRCGVPVANSRSFCAKVTLWCVGQAWHSWKEQASNG
jgi:hypothetical protein